MRFYSISDSAKRIVVTLVFMSIFINTVFASEIVFEPQDPSDSFFILVTSENCIGCIRAMQFIETLHELYPLNDGGYTRVDKAIVYTSDEEGIAISQRLFEAFEVDQMNRRTPTLFYTGGYIQGYRLIAQNLELLIQAGALQNFSEPEIDSEEATLSLPLIFSAGLVGGVNPCAISMILLLLSSLMASKNPKILAVGMTYIFSRFITYLFIGLALYNSLQFLSSDIFTYASSIAKWVAVALAVGLCIMNIIDFFNARREKYGKIRVQLPKKLREFNNRLIENTVNSGSRYMIPLVFLLGMVVSIGEFLCTGQIYVVTILNVALAGEIPAIQASFTYVIAMIIPMTILLLICAKGKRVLIMSEFARKKLPIIKLANAFLFLGFAIYMIGIN